MALITYIVVGWKLLLVITPILFYLSTVTLWSKIKFFLKHPRESLRYIFPKSVDADNFAINTSGTAAQIKFKYLGHHYSIWVPYDIIKSTTMNHCKYTLLDDKHNKHVLHHFPGIPILVSPSALGYQQLVIEDQINDTTKNVASSEIVGYP